MKIDKYILRNIWIKLIDLLHSYPPLVKSKNESTNFFLTLNSNKMKSIINTIKITAVIFLLSPTMTNAQVVEVNDRFWVMSSSPSTQEGKNEFTKNTAVNT